MKKLGYRRGTPCYLPALVGLLLAIFVFVPLTASDPFHIDAGVQEQIPLRLRYATFDPIVGSPIGSASDQFPIPDSGRQPYIVQCSGPIQADWLQQIAATDVQVIDYLPDYAYVVLTTAQTAARLRELTFVRWVGYLQPVYRIDPALLNAQGSTTVTVSLFPGSVADTAAMTIRRAGGVTLDDTPTGEATILRAVVPASNIRTLAADPSVAWVEPYRPRRLWNDVAGSISGVPAVWYGHGLRGQGQIIAIADTGLDTGNADNISRDFAGRLVAAHAWGRPDDWSDPDGHGTHVAGSAVGNGQNSGGNPATGDYSGSYAGVAPEAGLVVQSVLDEDGHLGGLPADLTLLLQQAYDDGARVHSNSWGVSVEDGGRVYDTQAQQVDRFMWQHPDTVVLFAAGNDGKDLNRDGVVDLGSVTTPATAKNILSVGASENIRLSGGYNSGAVCATWGGCWPDAFPALPLRDDRLSNNPNGMAAFSSRGPAPDGRLKPDLVAPGTNIISARSSIAPAANYWGSYDDFYAYDGGTSMATPLVAGAAALVRQYYQQLKDHLPSAALVKATLLAGAADMTPGQYGGQTEVPPAANNIEGWGRLDVSNALFPLPPRKVKFMDAAAGLSTGQSTTYNYTVASPAVPLRIVLAWTDYPGSPLALAALVNDLDLQVTLPVTATPQSGSHLTVDRLNNVEGVIIDRPVPGVYRVTVRGRNVPFAPQPYALVVSGDLWEPASPPTITLTNVPGFGVGGSVVSVTWTISGGNVITSTALLWDTSSHQSDHRYAHVIVVPVSSSRSYSAAFRLPMSGTVHLQASAWVDGELHYGSSEARINVVTGARRIFLPLVLTYPQPQATPTPLPTTTPVAAVQLIRNGGFEDAAPQSPPWQQYDRADPAGLLVADFWPRSGMWSAWMGGVYSDYQQLYQTVVIPAGVTHGSLLFHWYVNSEDEFDDPHDILYVRVLNAAGEPLQTLLQRDNTSRRNIWMATRYSWVGDFPYAGQTLRISFEMITDASRNTNLFVDDVSFFVSSGPIDGAENGAIDYIPR